MTGNSQNGPAPQGGMPGQGQNMPQQPAQQYQRAPQPMPSMPMQGAPQPQQAQQPQPQMQQPQSAQQAAQRPMAGGVPPMTPNGKGSAPAPAPAGPTGGADKKKRNLIILIGAIVVIALVALGVFLFSGGSNSGFYDPDAKEGQASYKTLEEIEAERNRQMQEGMLNISIASQIEFENGSSEGTAFIENVPSNKYVLKVTITTDNNGEVVYQSGGIRPDSTIETIKLSEPLGAGVYPATATFTAFDPDSLQEVGQAAAKVTLVVKN